MNVKQVKDKITVLIGGKPADPLPIGIGRDGAVARMSETDTVSPGAEFRKKLEEVNKCEAQFRTEREKATRLKGLASKKEAREHAELEGKNPATIIAGFQSEEKEADRGLQVCKDQKYNLFSAERDQIRASKDAVWSKVQGETIAPRNSQISRAFDSFEKDALELIDIASSEHAGAALADVKQFDEGVDSFNALAVQNGMAGNLRISENERLSHAFSYAVQASLTDIPRRIKSLGEKLTKALEVKVSAQAKRLMVELQRPANWRPPR